MAVLETTFWVSVVVALYAYGFYPLTVWLIGRRRPENGIPPTSETEWPCVSLVMTTSLDQAQAQDWIDSCRRLDYPADRLEVVVRPAQDERLDGALMTALDGPQVQVLNLPLDPDNEDAGGQNNAFAKVRGDIVVLTDIGVTLDSDAVQRLVRHFDDPSMSVASGRVLSADVMTGRHDDTPWRNFSAWLQDSETKCGLLPRVEPTICAMRRPMFEDLCSEGLGPKAFDRLGIDGAGGRTICDPRAVAFEESVGRSRRLVRAAAVSLRIVRSRLICAFRSRSFESAAALIGELHRALRLATPGLLMLAMTANVLLSNDPFYMRILLAHEALYVLAVVAWWLHQKNCDGDSETDTEFPALTTLCKRDISAISG